ncbi:MAG TPA: hypothetical protein VES60_13620 [Nakamurella sp.]|nr:hypothetical protein [Nakamurella sp.]
MLRNPYIWHFAMHSIPALPERLVRGREREYFDYFYGVLSPDPSRMAVSVVLLIGFDHPGRPRHHCDSSRQPAR